MFPKIEVFFDILHIERLHCAKIHITEQGKFNRTFKKLIKERNKNLKKTDFVVQQLLPEIENKDILEAACGSAEFSASAASYARSVSCIDIDDGRLIPITQDNICFEIMDAAKMRYPDGTFDTVFVYNALYHINSQWEEIEKECRRVLKPEGNIYIIGTWKLDISLMQDMFGERAEQKGDCLVVKLGNK